MLSQVTARTGHPVLILNGKLLASKFDPVTEAHKWLGQLTPLAQDSQIQIVLGAGSGQALLALAQRYPQSRVIAFTTELEIIEFWQKELNADESFKRVELVHLTSVDDFIASPIFFEIIEKTFVVHDHPSALVEGSWLFKALKEALLGRTYSTFCTQAQHHNSYREIVKILLPTIGPLSIKNIADSCNLAPDFQAQDRSEILILRELVK